MELEHLKKTPDPLIRLYEYTPDELKQLHHTFVALANGTLRAIALHEQPWIAVVGDCLLMLKFDEKNDRGVIPAPNSTAFECIFMAEGWLEVADKTAAMFDAGPNSFQWLTMEGDIDLLLSPRGLW